MGIKYLELKFKLQPDDSIMSLSSIFKGWFVKRLILVFLFISASVFSEDTLPKPVVVVTVIDPVAARNMIQEDLQEDYAEISGFQQSVQDKLKYKNVKFIPALPERYDEDAEKAAEDTARLTNDALDFLKNKMGLAPGECVTVGRGKTGDDGYAIQLSKYPEQFEDANSADDFDQNVDAPEYSQQEWSQHLKDKISQSGLAEIVPGDNKNWCPNYEGMKPDERNEFWYFLMMGMSYYESNWRPKLTFNEPSEELKGVVSSGLFQISTASASAYGGPCHNISQNELFDPKRNSECSVHMLKSLLLGKIGSTDRPNDGNSISAKVDKKWAGGAAYWSVLRKSETKGGILKMIKENVNRCFSAPQ